MAKITELSFEIKGKSGKSYSLEIFTMDTSFPSVGGIYIFTNRTKNTSGNFTHELVYCGRAEDLSTRFNNHHKDDCIKRNANCICVMRLDSNEGRIATENDILDGNNFKCNEVRN